MSNFLNKLKFNISVLFHELFHGLRNADDIILSQANEGADGQEVTHHIEIDSVYADLLREKKTQEVMETVDMSYRVAREADKYNVALIGDLGDDSVGSDKMLNAVATKKISMKYDKHPDVFNERFYHITVIQDNKLIQNISNLSATPEDLMNALRTGGNDFKSSISFKYDGFTPRFSLGNFVKRIVIRETSGGKKKTDLYIPLEPGQFTKTDAILVSELHRIIDNKIEKIDFLDISEIDFVSDRAYGTDDYVEYSLSGLKFNKITEFDGDFVVTFTISNISTFDIVDAHKTDTLTRKYKLVSPRKNSISIDDVSAIERRNNLLN